MAAHAGEYAREDGIFHCAKCNNRVRVNKGDNIPKCPNCGTIPMTSEPMRPAGDQQA